MLDVSYLLKRLEAYLNAFFSPLEIAGRLGSVRSIAVHKVFEQNG